MMSMHVLSPATKRWMCVCLTICVLCMHALMWVCLTRHLTLRSHVACHGSLVVASVCVFCAYFVINIAALNQHLSDTHMRMRMMLGAYTMVAARGSVYVRSCHTDWAQHFVDEHENTSCDTAPPFALWEQLMDARARTQSCMQLCTQLRAMYSTSEYAAFWSTMRMHMQCHYIAICTLMLALKAHDRFLIEMRYAESIQARRVLECIVLCRVHQVCGLPTIVE
jgi:hypothetical protein